MTIALVGNLGTGVSSTSSTSFPLGLSLTLNAGNVGILVVVTDNSGTVDGASQNEHTSVTDSVGDGTWVKLGEWVNSNGAAAAGVTVSVWKLRAVTQLTTTDTVTMNMSAAVVDKCASFFEFTVGADLVLDAGPIANDAVDASNGFGSQAFSGLASAHRLYFRGLGKEANTTTQITPSTNFTVISAIRSRNNAAAVIVRGEFRINTSTGETSNPTLAVSGDTAGVFVALSEFVAGGAIDTSGIAAAGTHAASVSGKRVGASAVAAAGSFARATVGKIIAGSGVAAAGTHTSAAVSKRAGSFAIVGVGSSASVESSKWADAFGAAMAGTHASMTAGAKNVSGVAGVGGYATVASWKIAYVSAHASVGGHAVAATSKVAQASAKAQTGTSARSMTSTIRYTSAIAIAGGFARMSSVLPIGIPARARLSLYEVTSVTLKFGMRRN